MGRLNDARFCRERQVTASFEKVSPRYPVGMETQRSKTRSEAPSIERETAQVRDDGTLVELVYDPGRHRTSFVVWQDGGWRFAPSFDNGENRRIVPFSADNNLIKTGALMLPSGPEEFGDERELIDEIQGYIHRYVDLSPAFERLASYYVLLSWVYDAFNEVPYLRVRGDYGTGKTRFLIVVGALCYKGFFASGASTISPIFHTLDSFRGTLIIDEADFRFSDEKAEVVKILNNGNVRGVPVLRTMISASKEYNPKAFQVFGPKLVATRGEYDDTALESRFLTEEMGRGRLRGDVPINLPQGYADEALRLRNKLLLYRLRNYSDVAIDPSFIDRQLEPRLNQIFVPLMSVVNDAAFREELASVARELQTTLVASRGFDMQTQLLEVIHDLLEKSVKPISVKMITTAFAKRYGDQFDYTITSHWVGRLLRRKLNLHTRKSDGVYIIPPSELAHLKVLFDKYGLEERARD
jgi:hypothetical protein